MSCKIEIFQKTPSPPFPATKKMYKTVKKMSRKLDWIVAMKYIFLHLLKKNVKNNKIRSKLSSAHCKLWRKSISLIFWGSWNLNLLNVARNKQLSKILSQAKFFFLNPLFCKFFKENCNYWSINPNSSSLPHLMNTRWRSTLLVSFWVEISIER